MATWSATTPERSTSPAPTPPSCRTTTPSPTRSTNGPLNGTVSMAVRNGGAIFEVLSLTQAGTTTLTASAAGLPDAAVDITVGLDDTAALASVDRNLVLTSEAVPDPLAPVAAL